MNYRGIAVFIALVLVIGLATFTLQAGAEDEIKDTWIDSRYVAICEEVGAEYGISPELLVAIIETESSGQQYASTGSCFGLCQIYKSVHLQRMRKLGITDVYDPKSNITLCADILKECQEKYGDDLMLTLMAYNGTSHAISKAEQGAFSSYAEKVSNRAWELEELHGKHDYSQYVTDPRQLEIRYKED